MGWCVGKEDVCVGDYAAMGDKTYLVLIGIYVGDRILFGHCR